jgi:hypothetical protein
VEIMRQLTTREGVLVFCRFPDDPHGGLVLVLPLARVFTELHTYIPLGLVVLVSGGLELHIADFADAHGSRSLPSYHSHLSFRHALSLRRSRRRASTMNFRLPHE